MILGVGGGRLGPTQTLAAALLLPSATTLVVPWWRGKCTPPHYIKALPGRDENTQKQATCSPLPGAPFPSLSLFSLSCGLPKGCVVARLHHRCTPSCCGVSGFGPTLSTSAISAGLEIPEVIMITVRVQVWRGAARVAPESLLQDLHYLEVGYVVFIVNACAGA
jgi:hypothetical protein